MKNTHLTQGALSLRTWLATSGVSQTRLAADLDVHFSTVTGWLRGHNIPRVRLWAAVERATAGAVPVLAWTQSTCVPASDASTPTSAAR
jgi:hypothetical protein